MSSRRAKRWRLRAGRALREAMRRRRALEALAGEVRLPDDGVLTIGFAGHRMRTPITP